MASYLLRRSGISVGLEADRLGWRPEMIIQVGIGFTHEETNVLTKEWPDCKWIGFEPHPHIVKKIHYPGLIHEVAIGRKVGMCTLHIKRRHADGSSTLPFGEDIQILKKLEVTQTTLDRILDINNLPDGILLWLDCEGSELDALIGAEKLMKSGKVKMLNVEMTPNKPAESWPDPSEVHRVISNYGFYRQWVHTLRDGQYDAIYACRDVFNPTYCSCPYSIHEWQTGRSLL